MRNLIIYIILTFFLSSCYSFYKTKKEETYYSNKEIKEKRKTKTRFGRVSLFRVGLDQGIDEILKTKTYAFNGNAKYSLKRKVNWCRLGTDVDYFEYCVYDTIQNKIIKNISYNRAKKWDVIYYNKKEYKFKPNLDSFRVCVKTIDPKAYEIICEGFD